jgi:RNA polymerase sporulation-specific sigma factor
MQTRKKAERENAKQHVVHKTSERRVFDNEQLAKLYKIYSEELAPLEKAVFPLYLQGQSYRDIAKQLSKDEKSIDNAVYRMKRKLRKRL